MGNWTQGRRRLAVATLSLCLGLGWGCAIPGTSSISYSYFEEPPPGDAWTRKIRAWQERERADWAATEASAPAAPPAEVAGAGESAAESPAEVGNLQSKYSAFRMARKRRTARELAAWIQSQARDHYVADGAVDHWATLDETLRSNGDDCDGLELLSYYFLRDAGFEEDEVFRAIVYRPSDGQHHMVTLWFETEDDPWVIDPTGAMTLGMPRMSELPDWVPLKIFTPERDFTVRAVPRATFADAK